MMLLPHEKSHINQRRNRAFERDFLLLAQPWHSGYGSPGQFTATGIFDRIRINLTQEVGHGIHP